MSNRLYAASRHQRSMMSISRNSHRFGASGFAFLAVLLTCSMSIAQIPRKKINPTRADREAWRQVLKIPDDCEKSFQSGYGDTANFGGLEFHRLGPSQYLVGITCYGGAYQPGSIYAFYDEYNPSRTRLLKLKGFETKRHGNPLRYSLIDGFDSFNRKTKQLEVFSKYRGPGDCGLFVRYRFLRDRPVVVEAREQNCSEIGFRRHIDYRRWPRKKL
ncbi:MAG TPA: hypothetical protein VHD88_07560 [Pyrinomonadaceae bacterium]|nr:hypothetical protein [Pyrinomonadaceae bacterium]